MSASGGLGSEAGSEAVSVRQFRWYLPAKRDSSSCGGRRSEGERLSRFCRELSQVCICGGEYLQATVHYWRCQQQGLRGMFFRQDCERKTRLHSWRRHVDDECGSGRGYGQDDVSLCGERGSFGGLFNCVSDRGVTLNGMVKLC